MPVVALILGGLLSLVWLLRHREINRAQRDTPVLTPRDHATPPDNPPRVSIIIAAKDEENAIETCVRTLANQDYPNLEIIVANDRSTDNTAEILSRLEEELAPQLKIKTIAELPDGWCGKPHAVHSAMHLATGDFFLFTDADCEQLTRQTVTLAQKWMDEHGVEFLCLTPQVETGGWVEPIVQPVCTAVLMIWHPPRRVNDPNTKTAYANGAFIMMRRETYQRIGGHQRVRDHMCEDMQFARYAKAEGIRLQVVQNRGLYVTRMYPSLRQVWRGWSRLLFACLLHPRKLLIAIAFLSIFSLGPWIGTAWAWGLVWASNTLAWPTGPLALVWTTALLAQLSVMWRVYPLLGAPRWIALTYPLGTMVCLGILVKATMASLGFGSTIWRGTTYAHAPTEMPAVPDQPAHVG